MRADNRTPHQLREVSITTGVNPHAEGSCLIRFGRTEVLVTASVQNKVPQWLRGKGQGWLTAEYGMLPRATEERKDREATKGKQEGRTLEIQRLIGRSLRSVCDLTVLDGYTLWLDCDVLVADGGTRTAAITGAWVAVRLAEAHLRSKNLLKNSRPFLTQQLAAMSCGIHKGNAVLDMDYMEDSTTEADANFVMTADGGWVEVQISAEKRPLRSAELSQMQALAEAGLKELFELQLAAVQATLSA